MRVEARVRNLPKGGDAKTRDRSDGFEKTIDGPWQS